MIGEQDLGPPGPERATPWRQTEAARKSTDDDSAPIVHPEAADKADPRKPGREVICH